MLGNDDFAELESLLLAEEQLGNLSYIHGRTRPLGRGRVLGYTCVLSKPFRYRHWERTEGQIGQDLAALTEGRDTAGLLLSIHQPPYGTNLDRLGPDGGHAGSRVVRSLLEGGRFGIGLFGHIHESHHLSGSRHDRVGGTLVINPGGYHDSRCCVSRLLRARIGEGCGSVVVFADATLGCRLDDDAIGHASCGMLRSRRMSANTSVRQVGHAGPACLPRPLPDAFENAGFLGEVEELLIRLRVLHDQSGFPVDGQHDRLAGRLELLDEFRRAVLEVGQRLDVAVQVHATVLLILK